MRGQVQAGQLKLLAVGGPTRWPTIPNVPTVAESGVPGYAVTGWYGWMYPAGTPQAIVDKTNAALKEVLARPAIQRTAREGRRRGACLDAGGIHQVRRGRGGEMEVGARKGGH